VEKMRDLSSFCQFVLKTQSSTLGHDKNLE
jgi:hypothetical protein